MGTNLRHVLLPVVFAGTLGAQSRPPIIGVAHIGLKTNDLAASRNFYGRDLGFQEPFTLNKATGGLLLTYFKVNDPQYIEVFPELKDDAEDRLSPSRSRPPTFTNSATISQAAA